MESVGKRSGREKRNGQGSARQRMVLFRATVR